MRTKFILLTMLGVAVVSAHAELNFPFIAPNCNIAISQPANDSGYYTDDSCKEIFVLPPRTGTVRVEAVQQLENMDLCPDLKRSYASQSQLDQKYQQLLERMTEENLSDHERANIVQDLKLIKDRIDMLNHEYADIPAAMVQVSYDRADTQSWMNQYAGLNQNTISEHQTTFQPAPIAESYLVFSAVTAKGKDSKLPPVLSANIPGLMPVNNNPNMLTGTAIQMNGSMSGQLELSLSGACGYDKTNKNSMVAYMVANSIYTVPVMSWAGYTASINADTAIKNLVKSWQTKTKFSVNEAADMLSEGSAGSAFNFKVTAFEMKNSPFSEQARKDFFSDLQNQVRERLTARLLKQMALAGFLQMEQAPSMAEAPAPGTVDEVHQGHSCHASGLFGWGHSCSDYSYVVKVDRSSSANLILNKINNTNFSDSESVSEREIIYRVHTGTYLPPQESKEL